MYVCICKAVTERHIEHAVRGGTTTLRGLRETLGVTSECGRCASCARDCLKGALNGAKRDQAQANGQLSDCHIPVALVAA